jgi:hypothetical protein
MTGDSHTRPSESNALCSRPGESSLDPFLNPCAFELAQRSEDVQLQPARRCPQVNALVERNEADTKRLEFLNDRYKVPQIAAESVQSPADDNIKLPALRCFQHLVQRRPTVLCTRDAVVNEFRRSPATGFNVSSQLMELILYVLVQR